MLQNQIQIGLQMQKDIENMKIGPTFSKPEITESGNKRPKTLGDLRYQMGLTMVKGFLQKRKRILMKTSLDRWKRNV